MRGYAQVRDLKCMLLPVPVFTPRLSSYWVQIVTPIPAGIARPLIDGLRNEVIVRTDTASKLFSEICPMDYKSAVGVGIARSGSPSNRNLMERFPGEQPGRCPACVTHYGFRYDH